MEDGREGGREVVQGKGMASGRGGVDLQFQWSIQNQSVRACPGTKT